MTQVLLISKAYVYYVLRTRRTDVSGRSHHYLSQLSHPRVAPTRSSQGKVRGGVGMTKGILLHQMSSHFTHIPFLEHPVIILKQLFLQCSRCIS